MIPNGIYFLSRKIKSINKTVKAQMLVEDGNFILKKGSIVTPCEKYKITSWLQIRQGLKLNANSELLEDIECSSPSMAAALAIGQNANGWTSWRNNKNQVIDIYRKRDIEED